ncbi:DUF1972 domain-containing protein [Lentibacter sp.]|uniref:DUF1972 domain-containing protein n=1 Tax=Lentibacter sp. TaxID=2024994 RepID=UPI003F69D491
MKGKKVAIIGTVGLPAQYGGFETLAENLTLFHKDSDLSCKLTVWCSGKHYTKRQSKHYNASLEYIDLNANGVQSIIYDILSLIKAIQKGHNSLLLLGVSGAVAIPFIRLCTKARVITNIDGLEWKREKWGFFARAFLKFSERLAVRYSHDVIADNKAISDYVNKEYGLPCNTIAYGGDHAVKIDENPSNIDTPGSYSLSLCRIEPENNAHMILEAFSETNENLIFVGNWDNSNYGKELKSRFRNFPNIRMLNPVYDKNNLYNLRRKAKIYVHGHSAGGTNPALVEMMHFETPTLAFDCSFNRFTTDEKALYFRNACDLRALLSNFDEEKFFKIGQEMKNIANEKYTWETVSREYFNLLLGKI